MHTHRNVSWVAYVDGALDDAFDDYHTLKNHNAIVYWANLVRFHHCHLKILKNLKTAWIRSKKIQTR